MYAGVGWGGGVGGGVEVIRVHSDFEPVWFGSHSKKCGLEKREDVERTSRLHGHWCIRTCDKEYDK